jgi:hypothetical protein
MFIVANISLSIWLISYFKLSIPYIVGHKSFSCQYQSKCILKLLHTKEEKVRFCVIYKAGIYETYEIRF